MYPRRDSYPFQGINGNSNQCRNEGGEDGRHQNVYEDAPISGSTATVIVAEGASVWGSSCMHWARALDTEVGFQELRSSRRLDVRGGSRLVPHVPKPGLLPEL